ncbi:MAG: NAD(P)H-hydrate epimerase [Candidatus Thorarchaeota archaeon]
MGLPGITRQQMIEVDRLMMEEYSIPVELMMEHAGLSFARLAVQLKPRSEFIVVAGSGNNGGGGLVAARRLHSWGYPVSITLARGVSVLRTIPTEQYKRAESIGVPVIDEIPDSDDNNTILDAYIGYGYTQREDPISDRIFDALRWHKSVVSLDVPSGFDVTTGESISGVRPLATLTVAFVKSGFLFASPEDVGSLYVCDIGVPQQVYQERLGIEWTHPYNLNALVDLSSAFRGDSIRKVITEQYSDTTTKTWKVDF